MPRFDVFDLGEVLVLDAQPDLFASLHTRIVVPLRPVAELRGELMPRLTPTLRVKSKRYIMSTSELTTIPTSRLAKPLANLENEQRAIIDALDFLVHGFRRPQPQG